ncbi:methyl-accepting chemotaxis protein [Selenomonas montiformis]|uniref:methyl-accepting chemotaxis protein n=1 Tax=Selenomonas montiformis TaxID=2652285 RepID=UPI0039F5E886
MRWINDIRVSFKILILAVIAAVALLFVGYTGYSMLDQANYRMSKMYNQKLKNLQSVDEMKYLMRDMQTHELNLADSKDAAVQQKNIKTIESINSRFHDTMDAYMDNVKGIDGVSERIDAASKAWDGLYKTGKQIESLVKEGKNDEARELYFKDGQANSSAAGKPIKELQKMTIDNAEEVYQRNLSKAGDATRNMILEGILALVVLVGTALWISREITRPLHEMQKTCENLKNGDFRLVEHTVTRGDEFGDMAATIAEMQVSLNRLMHNTNDSASQIAAASEELSASSEQSAQASAQVAESVQRAADAVQAQEGEVEKGTQAVTEANDSVGKMHHQAERVAAHAQEAYERADKGSEAVAGSVARIKSVETTVQQSAQIVDKLGKSSQEIGTIVETIGSIAEQTNLLALNAAIEAARAGEHGRGFSVVADEVRKLAEESAQAAQKIADLITAIQKDTAAAVSSMQDGSQAVADGAASVESLRQSFEEIRVFVDGVSKEANAMAAEIKKVNDGTNNISSQMQQIDAQGTTVSSEMENVSAATEEQSASAGEIATASESLSKLAQELTESLQKFQY